MRSQRGGSGDLLLLSTHPLRDDIIPAKLWDYLLADRPILSLCPNPEVGEWIDRYRAGIQATDAPHAARMLLGALNEGALAISRDPVPIAERMQRISGRAMAARMAEVFDLAMSATPRTSGGHP